ncbi:MAG: hypothetical protein ACREIJ_07750 [Nitrospiraceae bacterium]
MTTGVEGCNKLAIAEFWSKFNADREPLDEGAEPLPAEAAEPVEVTPGRGVVVDFVTGAVAGGVVLLAVSAVVCVTCPAATPDAGAARSVWDKVAGAVAEAMVGRLVNVRRCVNGMVGREPEFFGGPIGLVM